METKSWLFSWLHVHIDLDQKQRFYNVKTKSKPPVKWKCKLEDKRWLTYIWCSMGTVFSSSGKIKMLDHILLHLSGLRPVSVILLCFSIWKEINAEGGWVFLLLTPFCDIVLRLRRLHAIKVVMFTFLRDWQGRITSCYKSIGLFMGRRSVIGSKSLFIVSKTKSSTDRYVL